MEENLLPQCPDIGYSWIDCHVNRGKHIYRGKCRAKGKYGLYEAQLSYEICEKDWDSLSPSLGAQSSSDDCEIHTHISCERSWVFGTPVCKRWGLDTLWSRFANDVVQGPPKKE